MGIGKDTLGLLNEFASIAGQIFQFGSIGFQIVDLDRLITFLDRFPVSEPRRLSDCRVAAMEFPVKVITLGRVTTCLLYTSDAADE